MILKLYALVTTDKMRLFEIDAKSLRTGYVTLAGGNVAATVHWNKEDAEQVVESVREKSGSANFTIESVQIDPIDELVMQDIAEGNCPQEYKDYEIPEENQDE